MPLLQSSNKTLLLVEDEVLIAYTTMKQLEQLGYQVILAFNGPEAINIVRGNPKIGLILMDIDLGYGIDGIEAAQSILSERTIPIIFLTNSVDPLIEKKARAISSAGFLNKHLGEQRFHQSIKEALQNFSQEE